MTATLWEWPNARELIASLPLEEYFPGEKPAPGSLVRLWTWLELPGGGEVIPRHHAELQQPPKPSQDERERLRKLLDSLGVPTVTMGGDDTEA